VGAVAWRLMHPNGRAHIRGVYQNQAFFDPSLEPFIATAADAYCYYIALGYHCALRVLRPMALLDRKHQCFASRFRQSYYHVVKTFSQSFKLFEIGSVEAYLLSPLMSKRPKIIRISKAKNPKPPKVESPCDVSLSPVEEPEPANDTAETEAVDSEQVSTMEIEADADDIDDDDDEATPVAAETVTAWMTPEEYEASLPAVNDKLEEIADEAEYSVGDLVVVQNSSAAGVPGKYCEAIPSARVVSYLGNGIYEVAATYTTVEAQAGRKFRANAVLLSPKDEDDNLEGGTIPGQNEGASTLSQGTSKRQCIGTRQRKAAERSEAETRIESNVLLSAAMAIARLRS